MELKFLLYTIIFLVIILTIVLGINLRRKNRIVNNLNKYGFLGKKLSVLFFVLFLSLGTVGIVSIINNNNQDDRSLANSQENLDIQYSYVDDNLIITGKFKNSKAVLLNYEWEIEVYGSNPYILKELKESVSIISIQKPLYPVKITLTIKDNSLILGKKTIEIRN